MKGRKIYHRVKLHLLIGSAQGRGKKFIGEKSFFRAFTVTKTISLRYQYEDTTGEVGGKGGGTAPEWGEREEKEHGAVA